MTNIYHPLNSLREGHWFKLICGASFQHLPAVRNLTLAFTLAGADCIDVAADPAIVAAARSAIVAAQKIISREHASEESAVEQCSQAEESQLGNTQLSLPAIGSPWLMVSLNDGEDPHFRKAEFDPEACPNDCPRPCEIICPAQAITFHRPDDAPGQHSHPEGVIVDRCYGCGRCLPICPLQLITTRSWMVDPATLAPLVLEGVDALEIHTQVGRFAEFQRLWHAISPWTHQLKLIAISCPDGDGLIDYLWSLYELMAPLPCTLLWQTDGRPMSGDIGDGATRAAVKLGQKVLAAKLPGFVQLAGGTNSHTVEKLESLGLLNQRTLNQQSINEQSLPIPDRSPYIAGVAYGSYARVLLSPVLDKLEMLSINSGVAPMNDSALVTTEPCLQPIDLEAVPDLLQEAVSLASSLVAQLKSPLRLHESVPFR